MPDSQKYTIENLTGLSSDYLLRYFNNAFSDYSESTAFTLEAFKERLHRTGYSPEFSVGAFLEDEMLGFIFHGIQKNKGKLKVYNIATGVSPNARRQGLANRMYEFILPVFNEQKVDQCQHEVLKNNDRAIALYEKYSFEKARELICYKGQILEPAREFHGIEIVPERMVNMDLLQSFWDWKPSWQNSTFALKNAGDLIEYILAKRKESSVGYIAYNKVSNRIMQFAVHPDHRNQGIGKQLFSHLASRIDKPLINTDARFSSTHRFLENLGLEKTVSQYEMVRYLV